MADFGSGPNLSRNFDFNIDQSGDIETAIGVAELEKDISFLVADRLEEIGIGTVFDDSEIEDLRIEVGTVILQDPRIESIRDLGLEQDDDDQFRLNISADTTAADGPFDSVIPITL